MSQQLISRNPDLARLRAAGFDVKVVGGLLFVRNVPYVDSERKVRRGSLVSDLTLAGDTTAKPGTHVVHFVGVHPCDQDGTPLTKLVNSTTRRDLGDGLIADFTFSSKPRSGYEDYEHKMATYAALLEGPAAAIEPEATARTFPVVEDEGGHSPFVYVDTASSRAGIDSISALFDGLRVGIVGLGGTGGYILDLVAKTPVGEIHLWDGDVMLQHNAFRAPGAATVEQLQTRSTKVAHFASIYDCMHRGIHKHPEFVDDANVSQLCELDYVFVAIDSGEAKKIILTALLQSGIPFIDAGIGIYEVDGSLAGAVRVTTASEAKNDHIESTVSFGEASAANDYATNIQVADLNALNAALAVVRWKRLIGFYNDLENEHHALYDIDGNTITNAETP